jgi:crotonobetainyl-CoA:carnitine CoA-transferase CaiB-like acyl-CoA transferase
MTVDVPAPSLSPLSGVKVLDLSRYQAGPKATMMLSDLGADVYRAENPETERDGGFAGPAHEGQSIYYAVYNRGKKSIGLNLRRKEGRALLGELIPHVDVVVENFRPGYLDGLGFSYPQLHALNPRLILVSISGFGIDGPYANQTAFCNVALAASGYLAVSGDPFSPLHHTGVSVADRLAGVHAAVGAMAALVGRATTGQGRHVDVSLMDAALTMIEMPLATLLMTGQRPPASNENRRAGSSPNHVFYTQDGMILINAPKQEQWLRLLHLMGRDDLAQDPRFNTELNRQTNEARIAIEDLIAAWLAPKALQDAYKELVDAAVPAAPVRTIDEVAVDPQVLHRRMIVDVTNPLNGVEMRLTGNPVKVSDMDDVIGPVPEKGQHNTEVYGGWLGYSDERIAELAAAQVI